MPLSSTALQSDNGTEKMDLQRALKVTWSIATWSCGHIIKMWVLGKWPTFTNVAAFHSLMSELLSFNSIHLPVCLFGQHEDTTATSCLLYPEQTFFLSSVHWANPSLLYRLPSSWQVCPISASLGVTHCPIFCFSSWFCFSNISYVRRTAT